MITINLLPVEDQVAPPTSTKRIMVIAASALIGFIAFGFYLVVHFRSLPKAEEERNKLAVQHQQLVAKGIQAQHTAVTKLLKGLEAREKAVDNIKITRSELARKMNELANIFSNNSVWVEKLKVSTKKAPATRARGKKKKASTGPKIPTYQWDGKCNSAGGDLNTAIKFFFDLQKDEKFWKDFTAITAPNYKRIDLPDGFTQNVGYSFGMEMKMQIVPPVKEADKKTKKGKG